MGKIEKMFGHEKEKILTRIEELFKDDAGFIIIHTAKDHKVTDFYSGLCRPSVMQIIRQTTDTYPFWAKCVCKLCGKR